MISILPLSLSPWQLQDRCDSDSKTEWSEVRTTITPHTHTHTHLSPSLPRNYSKTGVTQTQTLDVFYASSAACGVGSMGD